MSNEPNIPPTGQPKPPASPAPRAPSRRSAKITGFTAKLAEGPTVELSRWYWVGVTPECPMDSLDFAGVNFPKINELITNDSQGIQARIPVIGGLVKLYRSDVEALRDQISRAVIRFREAFSPEKWDRSIRRDVSNRSNPPRKGEKVMIPTEKELAERDKNGFVVVRYERGQFDEPAARYVFAHLCDDQQRGSRGSYYPDSLEKTDEIPWPDTVGEPAAVA